MTLQKLIKPIVVSCLLPLAIAANAEDNFVTIRAGIDQPTVAENNSNIANVKTTYVGGIEVGRKFLDRFAVSLEYNHRGKSDFMIDNDYPNEETLSRSWAAKSDTVMANLSADLIQDSKITPYVKVGLGLSRNKAYSFNSYNGVSTMPFNQKNSTKFAWQVGVGMTLNTSQMIDTDIAYMFTNRGKIATCPNIAETTTSARYTQLKDHSVTIGIKIKF